MFVIECRLSWRERLRALWYGCVYVSQKNGDCPVALVFAPRDERYQRSNEMERLAYEISRPTPEHLETLGDPPFLAEAWLCGQDRAHPEWPSGDSNAENR